MSVPTYFGLTLTQLIIIANVVIISVYDVIIKMLYGNDATISVTIRRACEENYVWGVLAGLIFAHIFLSGVIHGR